MNQGEEQYKLIQDCELENGLKCEHEKKRASKHSLKQNRRKYSKRDPSESIKKPRPKEKETDEYYNLLKGDSKVIFKITRYNRITHKERLLTKNRRIISKCPHTSMKYYAKGMCK